MALGGGKNRWPPLGLHFSWNFSQGPIWGFPVSGFDFGGLIMQETPGSDLVIGGAYGPEAGLVGMFFRFVIMAMGLFYRPLPASFLLPASSTGNVGQADRAMPKPWNMPFRPMKILNNRGRAARDTAPRRSANVPLVNASLFFLVWLLILYAGADHPPPAGFGLLVLIDLLAALLVFWRVPRYLRWIAEKRHRLFRVTLDGLVAGLAFALVAMGLSTLLGGAPAVQPTGVAGAIWFSVLGFVGVVNAVTIYMVNWVVSVLYQKH